jgi:hypothetical protein
MEQLWNDDWQGKTEETQNDLFKCHFVYRELDIKSSGLEPEAPR